MFSCPIYWTLLLLKITVFIGLYRLSTIVDKFFNSSYIVMQTVKVKTDLSRRSETKIDYFQSLGILAYPTMLVAYLNVAWFVMVVNLSHKFVGLPNAIVGGADVILSQL